MRTFAPKAVFWLGVAMTFISFVVMASNVIFGVWRSPMPIADFREMSVHCGYAVVSMLVGVVLMIIGEMTSPEGCESSLLG